MRPIVDASPDARQPTPACDAPAHPDASAVHGQRASFAIPARFRLWALGFVLIGCGHTGPYVWASSLPAPDPNEARAVHVGDKLQVVVFGQAELSGEFEVRPSGDIVLPSVGPVHADGSPPEKVAADLTDRLRAVLAAPRVTVVISSRRIGQISVLGEVKNPGRYEVRDGEGILEALARAGGLTVFADTDSLYVVRKGKGPRVRFRYSDLVAGNPSSTGFLLKDGDVLVVE